MLLKGFGMTCRYISVLGQSKFTLLHDSSVHVRLSTVSTDSHKYRTLAIYGVPIEKHMIGYRVWCGVSVCMHFNQAVIGTLRCTYMYLHSRQIR